MKRLISLLLFTTLILSGCIGILDKEEEIIVIEETEDDDQVIISPNLNTPENYYRTVLHEGDYKHSEARGLIPHAVYNRLDINQLEIGLMELAQTRFPQNQFYFQEGQYLEGSLINRWLRRYDPDRESHREGLNPPLGEGATEREKHENQPAYLSHIMEHNYLKGVEDGSIELGGLVLGISLNSVYYYQTEAFGAVFEYPLEEEQLLEEGKRIAIEVLNRVRERGNLADVPIMIALYKEERRQAIVPGTFMALTVIEPGKRIERWETVNDAHYFFPSRQATTDFREDANRFASFKQDVDGFFENYVGLVGRGSYKNNQLQELTIEINLQTNGKAEIIAMTQYITDRMKKHFPATLTVQIYITSLGGAESIIVRHANDEPFVHIYR
ncbi:CamS family sex pheromone protein [Anaerobacillus isosaccharinicus]|uniref:CamS family sex pheromone protein n=1 Tax=Anaerobacillus isosaccharinicus TaxID=1532552 RepID=A0A1S2L5I7_9BACI|nr:CamS family sex pheromone protein [Anaerobacillus isosaccharinicus]MBA5588746.1 CamS family sex pheromone protein [Anaerobacillus isosaccharinicus]QOY37854.1 CamS family sex pheromone protein [Anaerobacillus isosaccharinicus]